MTTKMIYNAEFPNGKEVNYTEEEETAREIEAIEEAKRFKEFEAQEYARNRASEYPTMKDQLDYIFHNGVAKWKTDIIEPVKAKYPKPS